MTVPASPHPLARHDQLVISETDDHAIVYDERSHLIHQLNPTTAAVWRRCNGLQPVPDLQRLVSIDLDVTIPIEAINLALVQLSDAELLKTAWVSDSPPPRQSRRALLRNTVITGVIAAPALISISAPQAAAAMSCPSGQSDCYGECCADGQCSALQQQCCSVPLCDGRYCCPSGVCNQAGCCPVDSSLCGGACCPPGRACAGATCCAPGLAACGFNCCPPGDCYFGICCPAANQCGFGNCCAPGQTCSGGPFGTCQ